MFTYTKKKHKCIDINIFMYTYPSIYIYIYTGMHMCVCIYLDCSVYIHIDLPIPYTRIFTPKHPAASQRALAPRSAPCLLRSFTNRTMERTTWYGMKTQNQWDILWEYHGNIMGYHSITNNTGIVGYTVDGRNPNHQLKTVVYRIIYRVSTIRLVVQDFFHPRYEPGMCEFVYMGNF